MRVFLKDMEQKQTFYAEQGFALSTLRIWMSDGTLATLLYRLCCTFRDFKLAPVAWVIHKLNVFLNGCVIGVGTRFSKGLVMLHPVAVVINSKVRAGENLVIESSVVIGDEKGKAPVIGDNVFIGSGAKIIGDINIGDNVKIGANAVVLKDVPSNVTVVGIPAKIVKKDVS